MQAEKRATHLKMWSRGRATGSMASGSFSLFSSKMAWKETEGRSRPEGER